MGFIRGGLLVIASVLFFISLLIGGLLWTISLSLEYKTVKSELSSVVTEIIENETNIQGVIKDKMPEIETYCENNSEFVFSEEGYTIDIPCEKASEGSSAVLEEGISDIVEDIYYDEYDCSFIRCFKESGGKPFFLVSKIAHDYFQNRLYLMLTFALIFLIAMFFLIERKTNFPFLTGSLIVLASFLFIKLNWVSSFSPTGIILQIISIFLTQSSGVFWRFFITGVLIITLGIFLKFFGWGFKISNIFQKIQKKNSNKNKKSK